MTPKIRDMQQRLQLLAMTVEGVYATVPINKAAKSMMSKEQ
jgi:hypothetical protein